MAEQAQNVAPDAAADVPAAAGSPHSAVAASPSKSSSSSSPSKSSKKSSRKDGDKKKEKSSKKSGKSSSKSRSSSSKHGSSSALHSHNRNLAVNTIDIFNEVTLLFGTVSDFCTAETCPIMCAGENYQYWWADGMKIKAPIKLPAHDYISHLSVWISKLLNSEKIFPLSQGVAYPTDFEQYIKVMMKRLFRVFAHIYHSHAHEIAALELEEELNTSFMRFMDFVEQYKLVKPLEFAPLEKLIANLKALRGDQSGGGAATNVSSS